MCSSPPISTLSESMADSRLRHILNIPTSDSRSLALAVNNSLVFRGLFVIFVHVFICMYGLINSQRIHQQALLGEGFEGGWKSSEWIEG